MKTNILDTLAKRVSKKEIIEKSEYADGLFDILSFLFLDLWRYMKEENRFFGIIPTFQHKIQMEINRINDKFPEEEEEVERLINVYGKILYLFKPILINDFKRLCSKHLSKADAVIVIIHKIIEILNNTKWYSNKSELTRINTIIDKLFNNIRNNSKKTDLIQLVSSINFYMCEGWVGKIALHEFKLENEELELREKKSIEGSGVRFEETNLKNSSELVWKDE